MQKHISESDSRLNKFMSLSVQEIALVLLDSLPNISDSSFFKKKNKADRNNQIELFQSITSAINDSPYSRGGTDAMEQTLKHLESDGTVILESNYVKNWYMSALHMEEETWDILLDHTIQYLNMVLTR